MSTAAVRETQRLLREAYAENAQIDLVHEVYKRYIDTIVSHQTLADELWQLGEHRWSAACDTRVQDIEVQARRHIQAIAAREQAKQGKP
jgi:hypothetical protein